MFQFDKQQTLLSKLFLWLALLSVALVYVAPLISQSLAPPTHHSTMMTHDSHHQDNADSDLEHSWCEYCKLLAHLSWHSTSIHQFDAPDLKNSSSVLASYSVVFKRWMLSHIIPRAPPQAFSLKN
ncbi:DUF2946 domain-containing protein [Vibrio viridaestus]|uniref:DUF2946 domain-containing protein n=1 Tax=Vibrio viridaestus TaxID=2487322 RepID=A0A3N9U482_9VIBR|nr:DUF2946 domain-containing protein [Vibrio viridaestus]RQW64392.1 DUF2946 domain-containing protein [Vibrio viridaestus]